LHFLSHTNRIILRLLWCTAAFCIALSLLVLAFPRAYSAQDTQSSNQASPLARGQIIQQLPPAGQAELLAIVTAGELPELRWPRFGDLQVEVSEFYSSVGYSLAWIRSSAPTSQARGVIELLKSSVRKGLDPEDYDGPRWTARVQSLDHGGSPSDSILLRFDIGLTVSVMRYLSDLHRGRVSQRAQHFMLDVKNSEFDLSEFLRLRVINAADIETALAEVEPPFPTYRRTIHALQTYLALANSDDGTFLPVLSKPIDPGDRDPGVPRLTRLLRLLGDLPQQGVTTAAPELYQESLVEGVKRFQQRHGLDPNGRIDPETLRALNTPLRRRVRQLELTLERWRWLPRTFQPPAIAVNIPEFRLRAVDQNYRWILSMKVVVGKAYGHQTPVFASELRSITFRPSWNVPLAIQRDELLPEVEKDPLYLSANSYVITDSSGRAVVAADPADNEAREKLRSGELRLRQEPGPDNALDLIRFDLSDSFDIYLHGTPATELFSRSRRDFSHGCIRVEDPLALAVWVLRDNPEWTTDRMRTVMSGEKQSV